MSKYLIVLIVAVVALFAVSTIAGSRIAAGAGALILLAGIVYGLVRNRQGSRAQIERAERGAAKVREDIRKDPEYKEE